MLMLNLGCKGNKQINTKIKPVIIVCEWQV